jgi:hypothetical protein
MNRPSIPLNKKIVPAIELFVGVQGDNGDERRNDQDMEKTSRRPFVKVRPSFCRQKTLCETFSLLGGTKGVCVEMRVESKFFCRQSEASFTQVKNHLW